MVACKIKCTLKASSVLEVITAMVVIVTVLGIAMMILGNVMRSSVTVRKINVQALLQHNLTVAEQQNTFADSTFNAGELQIERKCFPYAGSDDLVEVRLTAYGPNRDSLAAVRKVLIR